MPRTLYGDNGVTDANGDDANEGIMRRGSGNGRRISNEKTAFLTPTTTWAIITPPPPPPSLRFAAQPRQHFSS